MSGQGTPMQFPAHRDVDGRSQHSSKCSTHAHPVHVDLVPDLTTMYIHVWKPAHDIAHNCVLHFTSRQTITGLYSCFASQSGNVQIAGLPVLAPLDVCAGPSSALAADCWPPAARVAQPSEKGLRTPSMTRLGD